MADFKKEIILEKENYLKFKKMMKLKGRLEGWCSPKGKSLVWDPKRFNEFGNYLLKILSVESADILSGAIENATSVEDVFTYLEKNLRVSGQDIIILEKEIMDNINFPVDMDPRHVLQWFETQFELYVINGGSNDLMTKTKFIRNGLRKNQFWSTVDESIYKLLCIKNDVTFDEITREIYIRWDGHANTSNPRKGPYIPATNHAATARQKRFCEFCHENGRRKISNTHDTPWCRFQKLAEKGNKTDEPYNRANYCIWDSGANQICTPIKPDDFRPEKGLVYTAGANQKPLEIIGSGTIRFGRVTAPCKYVPDLDNTLISATLLMKMGFKQEIEKEKLRVMDADSGELVATGIFDPRIDLIIMDKTVQQGAKTTFEKLDHACNTVDYDTLHKRLGHVGKGILEKTAKHYNIKTSKIKDNKRQMCEPCQLGKAKRSRFTRNKSSNNNENYDQPLDLLNVIESDTQILKVRSHNNTSINVKFIDKASGYLYMEFIPDIRTETITTVFDSLKRRLETQTEKKIKAVRTDGGTEYKGVFKDYLEKHGIQHQLGPPYRHHIPPEAERANQTILHWGRTNLIASKLPTEYYTEAMMYSVYIYNRLIHAGAEKSPFELLFKRQPKLDKLKPFGCIGYVYLPIEHRQNHNKIEENGKRCRLLGYGDEDGVEITMGYRVLIEEDKRIIYSPDVVFDENAEMKTLPEYDIPNPDISYIVDTIDSEQDDDENENSQDSNADNDEDDPSIVTTDPYDSPRSESTTSSDKSDSEWDVSFTTADDIDSDYEESDDSNYIGENENDMEDDDVDYNALYANSYNIWGNNGFANRVCSAISKNPLSVTVPKSYTEAIKSPHRQEWKDAMDKEMKAFKDHNVWDKVDALPAGTKPLQGKWVYNLKCDQNGNLERYKARFVAKGYNQKEGIDYNETFSPVVNITTVRLLIAIAASLNIDIYQDDVPTAFLRGILKEDIWMELPEGYGKGHVKLKKTIYGLKQSSREFNLVMKEWLLSQDFSQCKQDPCLYYRKSKIGTIFVALFVDDISSAGTNSQEMNEFRTSMHQYFNMKKENGGLMKWYLGIHIINKKNTIELSQELYIQNSLKKYSQYLPFEGRSTPLPLNYQKMIEDSENSGPPDLPYRSMVGTLMYAMCSTRPDLAFAVSIVSGYLDRPTKAHCDLVRHIYAYLRMNAKALTYVKHSPLILKGYVDASFQNREKLRSTSGFALCLGNNIISWKTKKQDNIAASSCEAEYYAAHLVSMEVMWLKHLLAEIGFSQDTIIVNEDNKSCIAIIKNPEHLTRTKHIASKYHIIRDYVEKKEMEFKYCPTNEQLADLFTKQLPGPRLRSDLQFLGVLPLSHSGGVSN